MRSRLKRTGKKGLTKRAGTLSVEGRQTRGRSRLRREDCVGRYLAGGEMGVENENE